jgi:hypothetical protein
MNKIRTPFDTSSQMGGLLKCPFRDFTWIAIAHATVHQSLPECTVTLLLVGTIVPRHAAITSDLVVRDKPITNTQAKPEMGNFREVFFRSILCCAIRFFWTGIPVLTGH